MIQPLKSFFDGVITGIESALHAVPPVIMLILLVLIATLYYTTPNVQKPRFHLFGPGNIVALVGMVLASGAIESTAGWALALPCAAMVLGALSSLRLRG